MNAINPCTDIRIDRSREIELARADIMAAVAWLNDNDDDTTVDDCVAYDAVGTVTKIKFTNGWSTFTVLMGSDYIRLA